MTPRSLLPALLVLAGSTLAHADRRWVRTNFHAHAHADHVDDDGTESPAQLHAALRAAGFDFSLHTPHCVPERGADGQRRLDAQRADEAALRVPGLSIAVGQELSVADGPNYAKRTEVLGQHAPGNLNHMTILGHRRFLPYRVLTPAQACDSAHQDGGICIVNHPGPGPFMWEEGYWEGPANRGHVDALEVYNGEARAAVGIDFEGRYREATAYRGLGLKIAATTGIDTHGPKSVAQAQGKIAGLAGPAKKLLRLVLPATDDARPELQAATMVLADGARVEDIVAAVKARRTVATWALPGLTASLDGLGEVRKTNDVKLHLQLSRKMEEVTLYREGTPAQTWHDVDAVDFAESVAKPTAYVFGAHDGNGRLMTSAVWFEPPQK